MQLASELPDVLGFECFLGEAEHLGCRLGHAAQFGDVATQAAHETGEGITFQNGTASSSVRRARVLRSWTMRLRSSCSSARNSLAARSECIAQPTLETLRCGSGPALRRCDP